MKCILLIISLLVVSTLTAHCERTVISLDGTWQIAQGGLADIPQVFDHSIPVPGLVDMAKPAFTEVGIPSAQRQAFWYKRTFFVPGPAHGTALLKINKAMFTTKVWLNGTLIGEHPGCFTPYEFNAGKAIRYNAENTLIVRVNTKDSVHRSVPTGTDYEKTIWQPGIYDSVSLILTGSVYVRWCSLTPQIKNGTVDLLVSIRNRKDTWQEVPVSVTVREWKSGKIVAKAGGEKEHIGPNLLLSYFRTLQIKKPRLWSPEDPFLYVAKIVVGEDSQEVRFGMREFRYDQKTGRAMLNGKPYYLRGSNFCMFRFFEDPLRGGLPWNREWVRKVLTQPKKLLHWNSARVCIAPFPEFWYDIADETGWLLQDEYPIWGFKEEWRQDQLEGDFYEWLNERVNHPSIVVWDACNETLTPRTGELIKAVRGMDRSGRPWDNGYSPRNLPTDAIELHPYTSVGRGEASRIGSALDKSFPRLAPGPLIINEYDAFWMARDGGKAPWFGKWYEDALGPNATLDQKRELLAYNAALTTEYWRARRQAAGVQWFCYLSYSKPGMVTSDNFSDMPNAVIEPHFLDYMHNAFSPLAVMIDDAEITYAPGEKCRFLIIVTNDLYTKESGTLTLKLLSDAKVVSAHPARFAVEALGQSVVKVNMTLPTKPGKYRLVAELIPAKGESVQCRRNVDIVTAEEARRLVSLSDNRPVTASSEYQGCPPNFAVDRRRGTRWSSQFSDPQWIMVDLGKPQTISRVVLDWENAYGKSHRIQVSTDKRTWTDAYSTDTGKGGLEEITFTPVTARYVRMYGTARGTEFGYSLWSFQVFEN